MNDSESEYEFYVGTATHLEGASLAIDGTARIDGKIVGKVAVKHLIVGPGGMVQGDISGETAKVEGTVEDSLTLTGKLTVCSSGRIRGKIQYGSIETMEGAKLVGEISTDWGSSLSEPVMSDRLEAFTSAVNSDDELTADD
ncbi:MAG: polymer-forming cytoskeletal protein [Pseudomonadota bacterium]|jgi:cytoskeletal protein CcmA (bactofilin family)|nr:polymer-forming cytoskeletal protein [Pseudomonadales bacterium]MEC7078620.1 polymer-forming cytoskeletal protein [Pseudomonadota bacterium]MEC7139395.1 polymer-forming cytoskeletal protein [Pseudomonadota bacterium]MEC7250439.1 polymer-forming cytoskeletal protein [Pseudomonadota bacterium]MEC7379368.1 polymer-forming cytoskeletal protein [Pseudomonadota bacterium]|tara:strand:+ start:1321 stop:1743 length:423 start_codon:yes stop_codon:yes gene_type:complete